jgi:hypothetical protein
MIVPYFPRAGIRLAPPKLLVDDQGSEILYDVALQWNLIIHDTCLLNLRPFTGFRHVANQHSQHGHDEHTGNDESVAMDNL